MSLSAFSLEVISQDIAILVVLLMRRPISRSALGIADTRFRMNDRGRFFVYLPGAMSVDLES